VKHLRPARETCEQCHWPAKFHGDKLVIRTHYDEDEQNTPRTTVLVLKVGGRAWKGSVGIHGRHIDTTARITYTTKDDRRLEIARIEYRSDSGAPVTYTDGSALTPEQKQKSEMRKMDCMDCHNRPSHTFESPERAVDRAMTEGRISPALPFIKKKAVEWLRASYAKRELALARIPAEADDFYQKNYAQVFAGQRAAIETAGREIAGIYALNVFPEMNVTWGTYPNHIGHKDSPGCFRCHDGEHKTADGQAIVSDCDTCHTFLAQEEVRPKILMDLARFTHEPPSRGATDSARACGPGTGSLGGL
jgi:hypothetical protein